MATQEDVVRRLMEQNAKMMATIHKLSTEVEQQREELLRLQGLEVQDAVDQAVPETEDWEAEANHPSFVLSFGQPTEAKLKRWRSWCRTCHGRCGCK